MKVIKYLLLVLFWNCTDKMEAVSWYRIYEMFQFQSFHMYGIIMTAVLTGIIGIQLIRRNKRHQGLAVEIQDKSKDRARY
jgi:hypothetical protein